MIAQIRSLSNEALHAQAKAAVEDERKATVRVIELLREIDRRLLFAEMRYGSLREYCMKELWMSEGAASRRIKAMELTRELPEAKEKLLSGELSLSNAARVERVFQAEGKTLAPEDKKEAFTQILGLSQSECERKLFQIFPETVKKLDEEKVRIVSEDRTKLELVLDDEFIRELEELKAIHTNRMKQGSYLELLRLLVSDALKKHREKADKSAAKAQAESELELQTELDKTDKSPSENVAATVFKRIQSGTKREHIPLALQRAVRERAKHRCEYPGCGSGHKTQIDHILMVCRGGTNELSNLRLYCRTHNLSAARRELGEKWMEKYVPRMS